MCVANPNYFNHLRKEKKEKKDLRLPFINPLLNPKLLLNVNNLWKYWSSVNHAMISKCETPCCFLIHSKSVFDHLHLNCLNIGSRLTGAIMPQINCL